MESFAFVPTEAFDHTKAAMYLPIRKAKRHRIATASKQFEYYGVVGIVGSDNRTVEARHELFDLLENSIPNSGETITAKITNGRLYAVAVGDKRRYRLSYIVDSGEYRHRHRTSNTENIYRRQRLPPKPARQIHKNRRAFLKDSTILCYTLSYPFSHHINQLSFKQLGEKMRFF